MKTRVPYESKSYDTPSVPLEGTMAPIIYILVWDLFTDFWNTTNSREDYEYNVFHDLSFFIKIPESNMNIREMTNLHYLQF